MKLAFLTTFDSRDVSYWSGTPFYMSHALAEQGAEIEYVHGFNRHLPAAFWLKKIWKRVTCYQRESPQFNIFSAKQYSRQAAKKLAHINHDAIVAPLIHPISYLSSKQPIILWTDALYAGLLGFYPGFCRHSASSVKQGNAITKECLDRAALTFFSSDWAARTALEIYGISQEKVKVIPFGANVECDHTIQDIQDMLKIRSRKTVKLLFIGKSWHRKGGDIVFKVTEALHEAGQPVELNFIGCYPPKNTAVPSYIKCHGFISKRTPEGMARITALLRESHFLFVPSRAEAYGIVFCEANAFGLPCLTSHVGGIGTIVKNHVNGMTFGLDAPVEAYCRYIMNMMANYAEYEQLALSAFHEYETRLNWKVASRIALEAIRGVLL
jgi:glycosyltransferase involved in cell wall biosynthesis